MSDAARGSDDRSTMTARTITPTANAVAHRLAERPSLLRRLFGRRGSGEGEFVVP